MKSIKKIYEKYDKFSRLGIIIDDFDLEKLDGLTEELILVFEPHTKEQQSIGNLIDILHGIQNEIEGFEISDVNLYPGKLRIIFQKKES